MASDESCVSGDASSLLHCPVCFEKFGKNRVPKLFPCQHTYCHICIGNMNINTGVIKCPICRADHRIPEGEVEKFPKNLTLQMFLEEHNTKRLQQVANLNRQQESEVSSVDKNQWPHRKKDSTHDSRYKETLELLSTLRVSIRDIKHSGELFEDTLNKIRRERAALSDTYETTKKTVQKVLGDIIKAANQRKKDLLDELEISYKESLAMLEAQEDTFKKEKESHEEFCRELTKTLEESGKAGGASSGELERRIQEAQTKDRNLHHENLVSSRRLSFNDENHKEILSDIRSWGNLQQELCTIRVPPPSHPEIGPNLPISGTDQAALNYYANKTKAVQIFGNEPGVMLSTPSCVSELSNGDVAVASAMSYEISIFASPRHKRCIRLTVPPAGSFNDGITGMCMSPTGRLYVSNPDMHTIHVSTPDGRTQYQLDVDPILRGEEFSPRGMACTPRGELYVCDWANHIIRVFDESREVRRFGERGVAAGKFVHPSDVALMPDGEVVVADFNNNRIQVFDGKTDKFLWTFGEQGSAPGQLKGPMGIAVDSNGFIAVSERYNNRVQLFTPRGKSFKILGGQEKGSIQFKTPLGITITKDNQIVVCDSRNDRVQVF